MHSKALLVFLVTSGATWAVAYDACEEDGVCPEKTNEIQDDNSAMQTFSRFVKGKRFIKGKDICGEYGDNPEAISACARCKEWEASTGVSASACMECGLECSEKDDAEFVSCHMTCLEDRGQTVDGLYPAENKAVEEANQPDDLAALEEKEALEEHPAIYEEESLTALGTTVSWWGRRRRRMWSWLRRRSPSTPTPDPTPKPTPPPTPVPDSPKQCFPDPSKHYLPLAVRHDPQEHFTFENASSLANDNGACAGKTFSAWDDSEFEVCCQERCRSQAWCLSFSHSQAGCKLFTVADPTTNMWDCWSKPYKPAHNCKAKSYIDYGKALKQTCAAYWHIQPGSDIKKRQREHCADLVAQASGGLIVSSCVDSDYWTKRCPQVETDIGKKTANCFAATLNGAGLAKSSAVAGYALTFKSIRDGCFPGCSPYTTTVAHGVACGTATACAIIGTIASIAMRNPASATILGVGCGLASCAVKALIDYFAGLDNCIAGDTLFSGKKISDYAIGDSIQALSFNGFSDGTALSSDTALKVKTGKVRGWASHAPASDKSLRKITLQSGAEIMTTPHHFLVVTTPDGTFALKKAEAVTLEDKALTVDSSGGVQGSQVASVEENITDRGGLFMPLVVIGDGSDAEPGDLLVTDSGIVVPLYSGDETVSAPEAREVFAAWLPVLPTIEDKLPCLLHVHEDQDLSRSVLVDLMNHFQATHQEDNAERMILEMDPEKFLCYVRNHLEEFPLDNVWKHCPNFESVMVESLECATHATNATGA